MLRSRKLMVNYNNKLPEIQKYQYEIHISKSQQEAIEISKKQRKFQIEKGITPSAQFAPLVCSGVTFTAMFFAMKGMVNCPVESMKFGGMGWFLDLTARDPYFILPILTASTMALNMKLGMDATDSIETNPQIVTLMKYGVPVMTLIATCTFPSALCVYWFTSNIISVLQGAFLRIPAVNNYFGFGELKKWSDADLPMKNINMFQQVPRIQPLNKLPHNRTNTQNFDKMGIGEALRKAELQKKAKRN
jgi:YidC/Oxa1 family membrane protein insertase